MAGPCGLHDTVGMAPQFNVVRQVDGRTPKRGTALQPLRDTNFGIVMPDSTIVSEILAEFLAALRSDRAVPAAVADAIAGSIQAGTLGSNETVRTVTALTRQAEHEA